MNPFFAALHAKGVGNIAIRSRPLSGFESMASAEQGFPPVDTVELGQPNSQHTAENAIMERFPSALSVNEADENSVPPVRVPAKQQFSPVLPADGGSGYPLRQQEGMVAEPVHLPTERLLTTWPQRGFPASRATPDHDTPNTAQLRDADIQPEAAETRASPERRTVGARTPPDDTGGNLHMGMGNKGIAVVEYPEPQLASARTAASSLPAGSQRRQPTEKVSKTQVEPVLNAEVVEHSNSVVSSSLRAERLPDNGLLETPSRPSVQRQAAGRSGDRRGLVEQREVLPLAAAVAETFAGRRAPEIAAEDTDRERKVTVEIGRLEIRDQRPAPPPPQRTKALKLGLSEYLERRRGRGRHE